jgi:peptidoglycan-associated lipoprotein
MKSAKILNVFVLGVLLVSIAAGCKKQPKNITSIPNRTITVGGGPTGGPLMPPGGTFDPNGPGSTGLGSEIGTPITGGTRDETTLDPQTIYFGFDRSAIDSSEQSKLDAVASFVKNDPTVLQIVVEGHCDERGTEEYNRSLGERRANAAREYLLQKHGLSSEKVTTASFGEDVPAVSGNTEEAFAKNRRAEFVIVRQ